MVFKASANGVRTAARMAARTAARTAVRTQGGLCTWGGPCVPCVSTSRRPLAVGISRQMGSILRALVRWRWRTLGTRPSGRIYPSCEMPPRGGQSESACRSQEGALMGGGGGGESLMGRRREPQHGRLGRSGGAAGSARRRSSRRGETKRIRPVRFDYNCPPFST